jgi:hypothetical protein
VRSSGRWAGYSLPGSSGYAPSSARLAEDGSAVVAVQEDRRIVTLAYRPGRGWHRLDDLARGARARLGGVAIDGSGIATLVYSLRTGGLRAATLLPGGDRWSASVRAGAGSVASGASVTSDLAGRVWLVSYPGRTARLAVLSRPPGGSWRHEGSFPAIAAELVVGPSGDVVVSYADARFNGRWALMRRDAATARWTMTEQRYLGGPAAINRAGDAVSAHIHPIEQGNFPQAFVDRYVAPPRARLLALRAPSRITRGRPATVRVAVSARGPVVVTLVTPGGPQIVVSRRATRAGAIDVVLPARLTRLVRAGGARLVADTGGHDVDTSARSTRLRVVG